MEIWTEVRRWVLTGELSKRSACKEYGLNWRTLEKMLSQVEPRGIRRRPPGRPPVAQGRPRPPRHLARRGRTRRLDGHRPHGATDDFGYNAVTDVVHVRDLHATMLHLLGIDHARFTVQFQGLDLKLTGVEPAKPVPWDDQWHTVKLVRDVASGRIAVYFDDLETPLMETTDTTFTAGRIGIGSFDDMNDFTNVTVRGRKAEAGPGK